MIWFVFEPRSVGLSFRKKLLIPLQAYLASSQKHPNGKKLWLKFGFKYPNGMAMGLIWDFWVIGLTDSNSLRYASYKHLLVVWKCTYLLDHLTCSLCRIGHALLTQRERLFMARGRAFTKHSTLLWFTPTNCPLSSLLGLIVYDMSTGIQYALHNTQIVRTACMLIVVTMNALDLPTSVLPFYT